MGVVIIRPRSIVRRGMKRTIEDLGALVTDSDVFTICDMHVDDWTAEQEAYVQAEIDRHKTED